MKTACGVIRDLLPLYAENMTAEESNALIREHFDECRDCSEYLKKLQNPIGEDEQASRSSSESSLRLVRKGIRTRKTTAALFWALVVFTVMLSVFSRIVRPEYISYQDSAVSVVESENGEVYARFSDSVTSCRVIKSVNESNQSVVEIEAWTSLWDRILCKTTPSVRISSNTDKTDIAYYCDLTTQSNNMQLIYGTDTQGYGTVLPRLVLSYYFMAALIAAGILGLAWLVLRKSQKAGRVCGYLFAAPLSYILAQLIVTTEFVSFNAGNDFIMNCIAAIAIYGVLVLATSLLRQRRQDSIVGQAKESD